MEMLKKSLSTTLLFLCASLLAVSSAYAKPIKMRISLDTAPAHVRNKSLAQFAELLTERSKGQLDIKIFSSAQLFRDRDVLKALRQGGIEMGMPGFWHMGGLVPEAAIPMLPAFYGLNIDQAEQILDGDFSKEINDRISKKSKVKVLGKWLTLGSAHSYSVEKPLRTHADMKGMKFRAPGGTPNVARIKALGAIPVKVAFSDLPLALSQGTIDGFLSSNESIVSSKLWESGLKYSIQDGQFVASYIPVVSQTFWKKLTPELQKIISDTWAESIVGMRAKTRAAQDKALEVLKSKGLIITVPTHEESRKMRETLLKIQPGLVKKMKIDQAVIDKVVKEVRAFN